MPDKTAKELAKEAVEKVLSGEGSFTSERVGYLMDALWWITHDEETPRDTVLSNLALVSGISLVALRQLQERLKEEESK
jgi:hypothetical protein